MADDIEWLDLPGRWTYGVCGDGRIFFIKYGTAWWDRGCHGDGAGGGGCAPGLAHGFGGVQGPGGLIQAGSKGSCPLQGSVPRCFPITRGHLGLLPVPPFSGLAAAWWMPLPSFPKICSFPFLWLEKKFPCVAKPPPCQRAFPEPPGVLTAPHFVFHSDETKSTSWVHPSTGYSVQSGHFSCAGKGQAPAPPACPLPSLGACHKKLQKHLGAPRAAGRAGVGFGGRLQMRREAMPHLVGMHEAP